MVGIDSFEDYYPRAQKEAKTERLNVLEEIAAGRQLLGLERQLSEARAQVLAATLELGWKQREADLLTRAEKSRLEVDRVAAIERLTLRRAADDSPPANAATAHDKGTEPVK